MYTCIFAKYILTMYSYSPHFFIGDLLKLEHKLIVSKILHNVYFGWMLFSNKAMRNNNFFCIACEK